MNETTIITHSGKHLDLANPKADQISILDIAHALSQICRFAGNTQGFYSVAQHCCYVSEFVESKYKFSALLHDAAEAYISDIPTPFKKLVPGIAAAEKVVSDAIGKKFGANHMHSEEVHKADRLVLNLEFRDLMGQEASENPPKGVYITPWASAFGNRRFLELFRKYSPTSEYSRNLGGHLL